MRGWVTCETWRPLLASHGPSVHDQWHPGNRPVTQRSAGAPQTGPEAGAAAPSCRRGGAASRLAASGASPGDRGGTRSAGVQARPSLDTCASGSDTQPPAVAPGGLGSGVAWLPALCRAPRADQWTRAGPRAPAWRNPECRPGTPVVLGRRPGPGCLPKSSGVASWKTAPTQVPAHSGLAPLLSFHRAHLKAAARPHLARPRA